MPITYDRIATTTLGSASATITFGSIAASWTDLRVVLVGKADADGTQTALRFNGITTNLYSRTRLQGDGSTATSRRDTSTNSIIIQDAYRAPLNWGLITIDIFSYAGSTNKTVLATSNDTLAASGTIFCSVGLWRSTNAITDVNLITAGGNWIAGTTATLYGILKA
jgi:hypothetical protein